MVVVVVVVVVKARWTCCRMRSRHYVSQGECRQSAEALTGWSGRGQTTGLWLAGLCLFGVLASCSVMALRILKSRARPATERRVEERKPR